MPSIKHDLRRGDSDSQRKYGGDLHPEDSGAWVRVLQQALTELGFALEAPTGEFTVLTEFAVREFQIYASMLQGAVEAPGAEPYPLRLKTQLFTEDDRYKGNVSGVANEATRAAMDKWHTAQRRCPVVAAAGHMAAGGLTILPGKENLWLAGPLGDDKPLVYVRDLTNHYAVPPEHTEHGWLLLGRYQTFVVKKKTKVVKWSGPQSVPLTKAAQCEILPELLVGKPLAALSAAQRATFKMIRAVAEREAGGFFDTVNGYDDCSMSVGLSQWTLGGAASPEPLSAVASGELGGFLSYLRKKDSAAFDRSFGRFGVVPEVEFGERGAAAFDGDQGRYLSRLTLASEPGQAPQIVSHVEQANWFRTWHWCYRAAMAGRYVDEFRRAMWDLTRQRCRYILEAEIPAELLPFKVPATAGPPAVIRLKDVFASELSGALLLRWHIKRPTHVVNCRMAGAAVLQAISRAIALTSTLLPDAPSDFWNRSPQTWTDKHESLLCQGILACASAVIAGIGEVAKWPSWAGGNNPQGFKLDPTIGKLDERRGSLQLDITDLPPLCDAAAICKRQQLAGKLSKGNKKRAAAGPHMLATGLPAAEPTERFGAYVLLSGLPTGDSGNPLRYPISHLVLTLERQEDNEPVQRGVMLPLLDAAATLAADLDEEPEDTILFSERPGAPFAVAQGCQVVGAPPTEQTWELDLNRIPWLAGLVSVTGARAQLTCRFDADGALLAIYFELSLQALTAQRFTWRFAAADHPASDCHFTDIQIGADGHSLHLPLATALVAKKELLRSYGLPLLARGDIDLRGELIVDLPAAGSLSLSLSAELRGTFEIDLGSPLTRLKVDGAAQLSWSADHGLQLTLLENPQLVLGLDPFALVSESAVKNKLVSHIWDRGPGAQDFLIALHCQPTLSGSVAFSWQSGGLSMSAELLRQLLSEVSQLLVDEERRLRSLAGEVLGSLLPTWVYFKKGASSLRRMAGQLAIPIELVVRGGSKEGTSLLHASGELCFGLPEDSADALWPIRPGTFACTGTLQLKVGDKEITSQFAELLSLHIGPNTEFDFVLDPAAPCLVWKKVLKQRIALCVPAHSGNLFDPGATPSDSGKSSFTFDLDSFSITSAGISLRGGVLAEQVSLGLPAFSAFKGPVAVHAPKSAATPQQPARIGDIEFRNSRLVYASLQATASLCYFDDAQGTFTLAFAQDDKNQLNVVGSLDVTKLAEFHVDRLFATFQIDVLHLETGYNSGAPPGKRWNSNGRISGRIRFLPPAGRAASELREMAELFKGLTLDFEDLDLRRLHFKEVRLAVPPKQFVFGQYLQVEVRGINLLPTEATSEETTCADLNKPREHFPLAAQLLGDVRLLKLPGIDAQLTLGDIKLTTARGSWVPSFSFSRIAAQLSLQGGFKMKGELDWIETAAERGFGGSFALTTEALGEIAGLLKIVGVRTSDGSLLPSFAFYCGVDLDLPLFAGFYLRKIGVGLGVRQRLRGFDDQKPLRQRLNDIVDGSSGIPFPGALSSWESSVPKTPGSNQETLRWMLVAYGGITYLRLPPTAEHLLSGSIVLAIDHNFDIIAGLNLWLFTAPVDTQQPDFVQHPCARGAIGISPREKQVYGYFRTLPSPRMGEHAPPIVRDVFSAIETSLRFVADPSGFIQEIGWPWENRVHLTLGPLHGEMQTGFRFGYYRGVLTAGMNWGVQAALDAEETLNINLRVASARVTFSVHGQAYLRCSLVGAITTGSELALLGDVRYGAMVRLGVSLEMRIKLGFIKIKIRGSISIEFSLSAALTLALDNRGVGFVGEAQVAVGLCGYRLSGRVHLAVSEQRVTQVRSTLQRLLPAGLSGASMPLVQPRRVAAPPAVPGGSLAAASGAAALSLSTAAVAAAPAAVPGSAAAPAGASVPLPNAPASAVPSTPAADTRATALPWNYLARREPKLTQLRVLLFPRPGTPYYRPAAGESARFALGLTELGKKRFRGFLGSPLRARESSAAPDTGYLLQDHVLSWSEDLAHRLPTEPGSAVQDLAVADLLPVALSGPPTSPRGTARGLWQPGDAALPEVVDPRTRRPLGSDADDATAGVAPADYHSPYLRRDHEYDHALKQCCREPSTPTSQLESTADGLDDMAVLLQELLELIRDSKALPQTALSGYSFGPYLHLVLVFELVAGDPEELDQLIDPKGPHILGGRPATLLSLIADVPGAPLPQLAYDLLPGPSHQSEREIALTWDFACRDVAAPAGESTPDPLRAYRELDRYVIQRANLLRLDQKPVLLETRPLWLESTQKQLVRPQFQLVDTRLQDVQEYDLLRYTVEARSIDDRVLASCVIQVERRFVRPLPASGQAQLVHLIGGPAAPAAADSALGESLEVGLLYTLPLSADELRQTIEQFGRDLPPADKPAATARLAQFEGMFGPCGPTEIPLQRVLASLRLRYRLVPAGSVGAYLGSPPAAVHTRWETPAGIDSTQHADVQFLAAEQSRPLPWAETEALAVPDWELITLAETRPTSPETAPGDTANAHPVGPLTVFRAVLRSDGAALAGLVRRLRSRSGQAVEFYVGLEVPRAKGQQLRRSPLTRCRHAVVFPGSAPPAAPETGYFRRGSTVDQLELLGLRQFPLPTDTPAFVTPEDITVDVRYAAAETGAAGALHLAWPHLDDDRGSARPPQPVIGYRVFCLDSYDSMPGATAPAPALCLEVMPEPLYRARPGSIDLRSSDGKCDWRLVPYSSVVLPAPEPLALQLVSSSAGGVRIETTPILLDATLNQWFAHCGGLFGEGELAAQGLTARLQCRQPIHYRGDPAPLSGSNSAQLLRERFTRLQEILAPATDPYGFIAAEALGLSCEATFRDGDGLALTPQLEAAAGQRAGSAGNHVVCLFFAEDGRLLLNVVRVLRRTSPSELQTPTAELKRALLMQLTGYYPAEANQDAQEILWQAIRAEAQKWFTELGGRWSKLNPLAASASATPGSPGPAVCLFYPEVAAPASADGTSSPRRVGHSAAIERDGMIRCVLPLPDRWAHAYQVVIRAVRRYETLLQQLAPPPPELPATQIARYGRPVAVARTQSLVPHNLVALPMVGGIQGLVFAHPAAFAAAASAALAVRGQYSGQTVALLRQIDPAQRQQLVSIFTEPGAVFEEISWPRYQHWLTSAGHERVGPAEQLALARQPDGSWPQSTAPVAATQSGLYGADRYVYPDLPAYYQYQLVVSSSAGRARSAQAVSGLVKPLYSELPAASQRPATVPCAHVVYDAEPRRLRLWLRCAYPRSYYRLHELRALWVEAEEPLRVGSGPRSAEVRFGSLPDVFLSSQVYIEAQPEVLLPLCRIKPPMLTQQSLVPSEQRRFVAEAQALGVSVQKDGERSVSVIQGNGQVELEDGAIYLSVTLNLADPRCEPLCGQLQRAQASGQLASLIYLRVEREGVTSPFVPHGDKEAV